MNKNTTSNIELLNILQKENIIINGIYAKDQLNKPLKPQLNQVKYSIKTSPRTNLGN